MFRLIPLLLLVALAYNAIVFLAPTAPEAAVLSVALPSDAEWTLSVGGLLVAVGLVLLYVEILKATRTSSAAIGDHLLSMAVFVAALLEFLLLPGFGTDTWFLIMLMTGIDVIAGFTVTIVAARRDIGLDQGLQ